MIEEQRFQADVVNHRVDVCVVGGGMSGICAAIAAARHGASTMLIHDRPVFGGNASSEIRMWICGAHGRDNKETGILEEIQLENCYRNPSGNYSIWDSVLYEKVAYQPNLSYLLNCSVTESTAEEVAGNKRRIVRLRAWETTTQTWHEVEARWFVDCSGDSILATTCGALYRVGREAQDEFNEDSAPSLGDDKTMGNSLLIQLRKTSSPQPFIAPRWAWRFESSEDFPFRMKGVNGANFWWIELGGLQDTIAEADLIRRDLVPAAYGVWDYIKNRAPEREKSANWALEWLGSLPGKRENRRYVGDHILTQNDVRAGGDFADVVAFGGWSMDDHHPAGLLYPGEPTIFHPAPSPYGIPYRSLYSANVDNLLFAGRNISTTHSALSSTRVMATCAVIGQAVGTAVAMCHHYGCPPATIGSNHLAELQHRLMLDDAWLPGQARGASDLTRESVITASEGNAAMLTQETERNRGDDRFGWEAAFGASIELSWDSATAVDALRLVLDSDLRNSKRMPCRYPLPGDRCAVPRHLLRSLVVESEQADGSWETVYQTANNYQRLLYAPIGGEHRRLRLRPLASWGGDVARIFRLDAQHESTDRAPVLAQGPTFQQVVARAAAEDLAPPAYDSTTSAARGHSA